MLQNRNLSVNDKKRLLLLATREIEKEGTNNPSQKSQQQIEEVDENSLFKHNPQIIVDFLHQFTEQKTMALKYTSHYWDKNSDGVYPYNTFREFKDKYLSILNDKNGRPLSTIEPLCKHLWMIIKNFLVNDDSTYPWSEYKLKIGYNRHLEHWMNANPGKQPFSMPISELPREIQPKPVNGKTLAYFSDVVDIFKHCIEFRDNDLFFAIMKIFKESPDHHIDMNMLSSLRGLSFYTDTELVKDALRIMASNIFQRSEYPNLQISRRLINIDCKERIELRILQVGSFSNRNVNDSKIVANTADGDIARIREKLKNLCDFSIESLFRVNEELIPCRINYLSSKEGTKRVEVIEKNECLGFSYILTFYTYNNE